MHVLLSLTRRVPGAQLAAYERSWRRLHAAAGDAGAHAWRFRSAAASEPARFLEFLEWHSDRPDPPAAGPLQQALAELDGAWPGEGETWQEVVAEQYQEGAP